MKRTSFLLAAAGIALSAAAQSPAPKRPMTFKDLMAMKRVSDPQISPSGKWILFSVTDVSLEQNTRTNHLWVVPTNTTGTNQERQLTTGSGESNGRFSPDGKSVAFSIDGQIDVAPWDEANGAILTGMASTHIAGGADGAIWSPDSKRLLFVASVYPECSAKPTWSEENACNKALDDAAEASPVKAQLFTALLYRHWNSYTGRKRSHVLVVDANAVDADLTNNIRDLTPQSAVGEAETPTFSLGGPLGYAWAPDSHEIAYVTNLDKVPAASTNNDVFTLRLDEPGAKAVKVSTSLGSDDGPQYSPDGKYLAFRSQLRAGYESDRYLLMRYDRTTKKETEAFPSFAGSVDEFIWVDSTNLLWTSSFEGEERVYETAGDKPFGIRLNGEYSQLALLPAGSRGANFVAAKVRVDSPAEIVRVAVSDGGGGSGTPDRFGVLVTTGANEHQLTHLNDPLISSLLLAPLESFWFPAADHTRVQGFLIKPPNFDPTRKYPVKFLIHGGPQGAWGDAWSYRWNPQLMAASGYVIVMINPRGSTGYGQAFTDGVNGDWGGKPYTDLMLGLDAAEARFPFLDKARECALGASYGGFMANWILTHPDPRRPDRFKCIVTHDGMFNPAAVYGDTEELWFNEWEFRRTLPNGKPDSEPAQPWRYAALPAAQDPFRKWSPMLSIQNARTPTLVIHSQRDYRLDVSEGFQLFTALQRLNVPSEMLYFPDEGHWVLKPQNAELWNKTVSEWCDRWVGLATTNATASSH